MNKLDIKLLIRNVPDFPKKGVQFKDITPILQNKKAFQYVLKQFYDRYKSKKVDAVVGIESRGFIFGGALANMLKCAFIPVRKQGRLPHKTLKQEYSLEYGTNVIEIHQDAIKKGEKVLIIDDLVATAGTALATAKLVEMLGGEIVEIAFLIELKNLKGRKKLNEYKIHSLISY